MPWSQPIWVLSIICINKAASHAVPWSLTRIKCCVWPSSFFDCPPPQIQLQLQCQKEPEKGPFLWGHDTHSFPPWLGQTKTYITHQSATKYIKGSRSISAFCTTPVLEFEQWWSIDACIDCWQSRWGALEKKQGWLLVPWHWRPGL